MKRLAFLPFAALALYAGCSDLTTPTGVAPSGRTQFDVAGPITGAVMTTAANPTCTPVNLNVGYASKLDVYVRTGSLGATSFKPGTYWAEVRSPGGTLLGRSVSDALTVEADGYPTGGCAQVWALVKKASSGYADDGFDDTVNPGGVYILGVCGDGSFAPNLCKYDMFKVANVVTPTPGRLVVQKFYDANANGVMDGAEGLMAGWKVAIKDQATQTWLEDVFTTYDEEYGTGAYTFTEYMPTPVAGVNWVNSDPGDGTLSKNGSVTEGNTTTIAFGNYCTVPSGGRTLGFWSNKNGQAQMGDGGTLEPELLLLRNHNLRNTAGANFDPATYAQFRTWLLDGNAVNMQYMLSVQMAAMVLNLEAGFVGGSSFVAGYGGTVASLVAAANAALADGSTATRSDMETLKNYLDALNNNGPVVSGTPCAFSF